MPEQKYTLFYDLHSGGGQKLEHGEMYFKGNDLETPKAFEAKFGRDPYNVTCSCCGSDYAVSEHTLEEVKKYYPKAVFIEM